MHNDWLEESGLALAAVAEVGEYLFFNPKISQVTTKETFRDVVTNCDIQAQNLILQKLSTGKYPIISEESVNGGQSFDAIQQNDVYWVVDPIDGTVNFVHNLPLYAVAVGLSCGNEFTVGAVTIPSLKELYFTYGNYGAYLNGKKLKFNSEGNFKNSLFGCIFSSNSKMAGRAKEYELFGVLNDNSRGCLRLGSAAVSICFVVAQRLDCVYGVNAKIWDIGAALAIAKKAGCTVYLCRKQNVFECDFIVGKENLVDEVRTLMQAR